MNRREFLAGSIATLTGIVIAPQVLGEELSREASLMRDLKKMTTDLEAQTFMRQINRYLSQDIDNHVLAGLQTTYGRILLVPHPQDPDLNHYDLFRVMRKLRQHSKLTLVVTSATSEFSAFTQLAKGYCW